MKQLLLALVLLSTSVSAQSYSSNYRRVARESEKIMSLTSDIIDGVMTYEKEKKVKPIIQEQLTTWKRSKRSFERLTGEEEQAMVQSVTEALAEVVETTNGDLKDWLSEDPRSEYGHAYVARMGELFSEVTTALETYANTYEVNVRASAIAERFEGQMELVSYTKEMKKGAKTVDSLVVVLKNDVGSTDVERMVVSQKLLVKALSKHLRGYGEEMFYNGQTELHEAYQKYYIGLLELASADLLADLTKMKYDLVEFNSIATSTENSARKTLSFFDNEKKLLAKRESRFVQRNLPKAPKK